MSIDRAIPLVKSLSPGDTALSTLFHRINRLLPEEQEIIRIPPGMRASEALKLMQERAYTQLPVVEGDEVLGVFSYRSFSLGVVLMKSGREMPGDLPVEEFIETPAFALISDEFSELFDRLDKLDAVLIGSQERLQGIVTAMDVLLYLYKVASPFVLLAEIELALRALIECAVDETELVECISVSLSERYKQDDLPTCLQEMSFNDYVQLVVDTRNWPKFQWSFGGSRERVNARLAPVRELRNEIFHFRREITGEDHQNISDCRNWLLMRTRSVDARRRKEIDE